MSDIPFVDRPDHRRWLLDQARDLIAFFAANAVNPAGGFHTLDDDGQPLGDTTQELFYNCRMVHCFAAAHALGHPGAMAIVDHGISFLLAHHFDSKEGGFFWGVDETGPTQSDKLAYGHAFVLLAAASAHEVGHPKALHLSELVMQAIDTHFWDESAGAMREEFAADWTPLSDYRGQNANMHSVEALMSAYEAFGDPRYLAMAERIADLIINRHARAAGWVVIEHFHADWTPDFAYAGDPMFRPAGTTPGHALEWARLLIQLWNLGQQQHAWMPEAAVALFNGACDAGWDSANGAFYYTLDFDNKPDERILLWWPACEGVAAAATLQAAVGGPEFEARYRDIWTTLAKDFIDPKGGWAPVSRAAAIVGTNPFRGKPDIYHSLQACLIPLLPVDRGLLKGLASLDSITGNVVR